MERKVIGEVLPGLPISQAIEVNGFIFLCGQVGADTVTDEPAGNTIESQTKKLLRI